MSTAAKDKESGKFSLKTVSTIVAIIGGCLGIAGTCLGIVFLLRPSLKPDEPPVEMGATISDISVEYNISFEDYLSSNGAAWNISPAGYTPQELSEIGNVVNFTLEIRGYKDKVCPLQWSLFNADTNSRVPEMTAMFWAEIIPLAGVDRISEAIWVPYPPNDGDFFVRLEILDYKGLRLATGDTEIFTFGDAEEP
jgi:hypothetical protein